MNDSPTPPEHGDQPSPTPSEQQDSTPTSGQTPPDRGPQRPTPSSASAQNRSTQSARPPRRSGPARPPQGAPAYPPYPYPYPPAPQKSIFRTVFRIVGAGVAAFVMLIVGLYIGFVGGALVGLDSGGGVQETVHRAGTGPSTDRIAIIPIVGMIDQSTSQFVQTCVDRVIEDETIKAVVIRVESGGGMVAPSDQIWNQFKRLKSERNLPVVASFGGVAASGGYYVAVGSDEIIVEPTCVTGSIGVIAQVLTFEGTMEKLGIEPVTIVASGSEQKDIGNNVFRTWTPADVDRWKVILDAAHKQFVDVVYQGRSDKLSYDEVVSIANGSIYVAQDAVDKKLADQIGYLAEAINNARIRSGMTHEDPPVVMYQQIVGFSALLGGASTQAGQADSQRLMEMNPGEIRNWMLELSVPQPLYMMTP